MKGSLGYLENSVKVFQRTAKFPADIQFRTADIRMK